jgi:hypothetical protein
MSTSNQSYTAIIPAGGRFPDDSYHLVLKALAEIDGRTLLEIVLSALSKVNQIERKIVVGPWEGISDIAKKYKAGWVDDTGSLLGNVQAGLKLDEIPDSDQIIVVSSDLAEPKAESISAFLDNSPDDAELTIPLVSKEDFMREYPGSPSTFIKLRDGSFTVGSLLTAPAALIRNPPDALAALLGNRKSQFAMARALGISTVWGFLTGSLSIENLEHKVTKLTGVKSVAIRNSAPDLALDVDDENDLLYARSESLFLKS